MDDQVSILEKIREDRRNILGLILFAVVMAGLLNLATSAIFSAIWPENTRYQISQLVLYLALCLLTIGFGLRFIYYRDISEEADLQLLVPLIVRGNALELPLLKGYTPSRYASLLLGKRLKKDTVLMKDIIKGIEEKVPDEIKLGKNPLTPELSALAQAIILFLIDRYGEHTLTTSALYHPTYRPLAWKFSAQKIEFQELPTSLKANQFLAKFQEAETSQRGTEEKPYGLRVTIPKGFGINPGLNHDNDHKISLGSGYGRITFSVLPHWSIIRPGDKQYKIALKGLNLVSEKGLNLFLVPLQISLVLRGKSMFSNQAQHHYLWMNGLMRDSKRFFDWGAYVEADLERMIVDIYQKLMANGGQTPLEESV